MARRSGTLTASGLVPAPYRARLAVARPPVDVHVRAIHIVSTRAAMRLAPVLVGDRVCAALRVLGRRLQRQVSRVHAPAVKAREATGAALGAVVAFVVNLPMVSVSTWREGDAVRAFVGDTVCRYSTPVDRRHPVAGRLGNCAGPVPTAVGGLLDVGVETPSNHRHGRIVAAHGGDC